MYLIKRAGDSLPIEYDDFSLTNALRKACDVAVTTARLAPGEPATVRVYHRSQHTGDVTDATITITSER